MQINIVSGASRLLIASAATLVSAAALAAIPNRPPSISGIPASAVTAGASYSFQPSASDADGDALVYSITDKPVWARLDKATGRLTGTPSPLQAGAYARIEISVSDGTKRAKLPKFTINVTANAQANHPPSISGSPITTVIAGRGYSFLPTATDADGDTLVFSVTSKPSWAKLDKASGRLTGSPTHAQLGAYEQIEISAADGSSRAKLPKFTVTVTSGEPEVRSLTVTWTPPTQNTDGTALTNLSGYRINYGTAPGRYTNSIDITSAGVTRREVEELVAGRYYFSITTRNSGGTESAPSNEASAEVT